MKIIRANQQGLQKQTTNFFTGEVLRGPLVPEGESKDFIVGCVGFSKGVRNKFHTHTCDQLLIVTAGEGIVATEDEQWTVSVGDVVMIPAGLNHWHGATSESDFTHIAIVTSGSTTTQTEE